MVRPLGVLLALVLVACSAGLATPDLSDVTIQEFVPETGTLVPGDSAVSAIRVRNGGATTLTLWIGASVQDPGGVWHDLPAHRLVLRPGQLSAPQRKSWTVPPEQAALPGGHRVVMAVWSDRPGTAGAVRLADADRANAFQVLVALAPLAEHPDRGWTASSHALGRGRFLPRQVWALGDEGFRLGLLPGRCDGAEIQSAEPVRFGVHTARMRLPDAPGSLSAWFLYEKVTGGSDEIDIEILNDGSRRAILAVWIRGRTVHLKEVTLPFDPAAGFHDYTIHWFPNELALLADGVPLGRWTSDIPQRPMHRMANLWWPTWLACNPPSTPRELHIQWIRSGTEPTLPGAG